MHGIGQSLKAACRHAADGADQGQDTTVHQLAGWMEKREAAEKEGRGRGKLEFKVFFIFHRMEKML